MKFCRGCNKEKAISEFTRDRWGKNGLKSRCRSCLTAQKREARHRNPIPNRRACKRWAAKNPELVKAYGLKYREANREKVNACARRWRLNPRNRNRCKFLGKKACLKKYGLTPEQYDERCLAQGNRCAVCKESDKGQRLSVDHCHRTGRVRGLLCRSCNTALGLLKEKSSLFLKAVEYLKRPRCDY